MRPGIDPDCCSAPRNQSIPPKHRAFKPPGARNLAPEAPHGQPHNWCVPAAHLLCTSPLVIGGAVVVLREPRMRGNCRGGGTCPVALVAIVLVGAGQHQTERPRARRLAPHPLPQPHPERPRLRPALRCSRCSRASITTACSTWPTTSSSTTRTATRTCRNCKPAATGSASRSRDATFLLTLLEATLAAAPDPLHADPRQVQRDRHRQEPLHDQGQKPSKVRSRVGRRLPDRVGRRRSPRSSTWPKTGGCWPSRRWRMWLVVIAVFLQLPDDKFHQSRLNPVIHARYTSMLRVGFITLLFTALTVVDQAHRQPVVGCCTSCCSGSCRCSRRSRSS